MSDITYMDRVISDRYNINNTSRFYILNKELFSTIPFDIETDKELIDSFLSCLLRENKMT